MREYKWIVAFVLAQVFIAHPSFGQTCPQPFTLRQESCPAGVSTCTSKGSVLTWQELDRDIINIVGLCNEVGPYNFPSPSAGIFTSNGSGTVTIGTLSGDVVSSGLTTTIQANSVALGTDTTNNYAAGDAEAGNATGLACTTCVDASDIANDAVTEAKLKVVDSPADEECLTYESTGGDYEWQSCGSGGSVSALPRSRVRASADLTIVTATDTALSFNTEDVDQGGFHDNVVNNTRLTVPSGEDGTYIINCGILIQQGTNERIVRLRKNGSTIFAEHKDGGIGNTAINMGLATTAVLELVATDYVECVVYHAHGSNILVRADERTHFSITKMR